MGTGERPSTADRDSLSELSRSISQTADTLFAAGNVTDTLTSVIEMAVATIEGCDFAGLFTLDGRVLTGPLLADPTVLAVDALQLRPGRLLRAGVVLGRYIYRGRPVVPRRRSFLRACRSSFGLSERLPRAFARPR